jgi:hypothetical protein
MNKNSQPQNADAFSVVANLAGSELLDELYHGLRSVNPVEFALFSGAMRSTESTRYGDMVESVGEFRPGIDQPTQINIPATLSAERPQANRIRTDVDIPKLLIVADLPERLKTTTGKETLHTLGRYSIALGLVMAQRARTRATMILADFDGAEEVFDDSASESYLVMEAIDSPKVLTAVEQNSSLATALTIAEGETFGARDVALIVSDFMDGFQIDGTADWQEPLSRLAGSLDDRLLTVGLRSPAQLDIPAGISNLPLERMMTVREAYASNAQIKARRISSALGHLRHTFVDAGDTSIHPVVQINDFLVGSD